MNKETVEIAANEYADYNVFEFNGNLFSNNNDEAGNAYKCSTESFKAGARWQEQQSANEAVEFFKWVNKVYRESETIRENDIQITFYVHRSNGGLLQTVENLYELWQKTK